MIWIQENKGLAFLFGFFAVAILAAAAVFYFSRSNYLQQYGIFEQTRNSVQKKESAPLYPDTESVTLLQDEIVKYEEQSAELYKELTSIGEGVPNQSPLDTALSGEDFQSKLGQELNSIRQQAERNGVTLPENFTMGFEDWVTRPAKKEAVPKLDYMLESIDALMTVAIGSGITEVRGVKRTKVDEESAVAKKDPKPLANKAKRRVERYTVELSLVTTHDGLQELMNKLSNASEGQFPFFSVRLINVRNQAQVGPSKQEAFEPQPVNDFPDFDQPGDGSFDPGLAPPIDGGGVDPATGGQTVYKDVRTLLGEEKLEVYMMVDFLRFEAPEKKEGDKDGKDGKATDKP